MCAPKVVSNWKLLMILVVVVSVGVVLIMIGTAVPEIRYEAREELVRCVGGRWEGGRWGVYVMNFTIFVFSLPGERLASSLLSSP